MVTISCLETLLHFADIQPEDVGILVNALMCLYYPRRNLSALFPPVGAGSSQPIQFAVQVQNTQYS
jgi:hypothetical protein